MARHGCKRMVFSSSATVYGTPKTVPIKEDFPLSTTNPYGSTKLMIEQILRDVYVSDNEWSIALLRYFNPIGAHKSGLMGLGHLKALDKVLSSNGVDAYNLGTGKGYSVLEIVQAFEKATGKKVPYAIMPRRPGDIAACYADPSKSRDELGFTATRGIQEMCEDSWRFMEQNPDGL